MLEEFLTKKGLIKLIVCAKGYNPTLVQEFYSNLTPAIKTQSAEGYHHVFVRRKMVEFSPDIINEFLEFPTESEDDMFEEGFEYTNEVLKKITGEKCSSWGPELRLSVSLLTVKYNVMFRLGIFNWFLMAHNSSILKEIALLLYTMVTRRKFNLGKFIF